jgi:hypothetical protein
LEQAVLTYRQEWLLERGFHRLKGVPLSLSLLFVKRDDQVVGLTNLLSLAVRFLRRSISLAPPGSEILHCVQNDMPGYYAARKPYLYVYTVFGAISIWF